MTRHALLSQLDQLTSTVAPSDLSTDELAAVVAALDAAHARVSSAPRLRLVTT